MNFENFVLTIDNFYTHEQCKNVIDLFEKAEQLGLTLSRKQSHNDQAHIKSDNQLYVDIIKNTELNIGDFSDFVEFCNIFWKSAYPIYAEKYSALNQIATHTVRSIKIQKTEIGEGYHAWHCEDDSRDNAARILTFILYLNDVNEGGETEFLYYPKRIKAEAGKLILWPAGFTHTHRGNPPLSNTKYILTGWVEFA